MSVIATCITHPLAVNETFLVSDGRDVSTAELLKMIAAALNRKLVLFSLPLALLMGLAVMAGKGKEIDRLTGSLCVDITKIRHVLGWKPPFSMEEGIAATIKGY